MARISSSGLVLVLLFGACIALSDQESKEDIISGFREQGATIEGAARATSPGNPQDTELPHTSYHLHCLLGYGTAALEWLTAFKTFSLQFASESAEHFINVGKFIRRLPSAILSTVAKFPTSLRNLMASKTQIWPCVLKLYSNLKSVCAEIITKITKSLSRFSYWKERMSASFAKPKGRGWQLKEQDFDYERIYFITVIIGITATLCVLWYQYIREVSTVANSVDKHITKLIKDMELQGREDGSQKEELSAKERTMIAAKKGKKRRQARRNLRGFVG